MGSNELNIIMYDIDVVDKFQDDLNEILTNDPPPIYLDDSSIGAYEYWGSKEVDPPHITVEIDEINRDVLMNIGDYSPDIVDLINDEDIFSFVIDDYYGLKYNYHIVKAKKIDENKFIITVNWDDIEDI